MDFDSDEDPNLEYTPRFSEEEFDSGEEQQSDADAVVASLTEPSAPAAPDYMSEAVRRIELAGYWRELINAPLFEQSDENAIQVEQEVRAFVEDRMQVLLGIKTDGRPIAPVVKSPFTEEEVASLKTLAAFTASELRILKMLISSAARRVNVLDDKKGSALAAGATPAPTVRRRPVPPGTPAPAKPAPKPAQRPAPQPAPQPAPPPRTARPASPAQSNGRPTVRRPGARTAPARRAAGEPMPPPPKMEEKRIVGHPETGKPVEITARRIQRPQGQVPFPTDPRQFEAMSAITASAQTRAFEANPDIQNRSNNA